MTNPKLSPRTCTYPNLMPTASISLQGNPIQQRGFAAFPCGSAAIVIYGFLRRARHDADAFFLNVHSNMTVTSMYYLEPAELYKSEKPFFVSFPVDNIENATQTNISQSRHENIAVFDVRGRETEFTLDSTGFELSQYTSRFKHSDFDDFDSMKHAYFEEVEAFLKQRLRASWVRVFDCDVRNQIPNIVKRIDIRQDTTSQCRLSKHTIWRRLSAGANGPCW